MKIKKCPQIMTKKGFIQQVTRGKLSADKVLTKLTEELYRILMLNLVLNLFQGQRPWNNPEMNSGQGDKLRLLQEPH